jgi:transposase
VARESIRLGVAALFAAGEDNAEVARRLRVHVRSVQRWRQAWTAGGEAGLASKGPASYPALSDELFAGRKRAAYGRHSRTRLSKS